MGLDEYRRKRDFKLTREPRGRVARERPAEARQFVVQKHAARRLHYDFRLELDGVLKSWAVPKGPSLVPGERRMAAQTEDHPLEYGGFEGVIPAGEYGAGAVVVWDRGHWEPIGDARAGLEKGDLTFRLAGEKLRGRWHLVRMRPGPRDRGKSSWLLIKGRDEEARDAAAPPITETDPASVLTGRDVTDVARDADRVWSSEQGEVEPPAKASAKSRARTGGRGSRRAAVTTPAKRVKAPDLPAPGDPSALPGARRAALPKTLEPQLARLVDAAPEGDGWLHEIKLDGYRLLCRIEKGVVRLVTRGGLDWTSRFPSLVPALEALPVDSAMLDGEAVVLDAEGRSSFQALQQALAAPGASQRRPALPADDLGRRDPEDRTDRRSDNRGALGGGPARPRDLHLFLFDLPYLDGHDLRRSRLDERKALLRQLLARAPEGAPLHWSDHVAGHGPAFLSEACRRGVEGVVSKRADAPYQSGRTRTWLKTKCMRRQEFVVVGFTDPSGARAGLGALLLGAHDEQGTLRYTGKVGTGFDTETLVALRRRLGSIERATAPAAGAPRARGQHWVEPRLVAEIAFSEWTADAKIRHPSFLGLREDKPAQEVRMERAQPVQATSDVNAAASTDGPQSTRPAQSTAAEPRAGARASQRSTGKEKTSHRPSSSSTGKTTASRGAPPVVAEVAGVRLSHPDRVYYPEDGITKSELAQYYERMADRVLPGLAHRPLSLVRCPEGYQGECFYQKRANRSIPKNVARVVVKKGREAYAMVTDLPSLISLVQVGVLELHVWGARADRLDRPDLFILDLDPDDAVEWPRVADTARALRALLEELGLVPFVRSTGGKGLHLVAPIERRSTWDKVKELAQAIALQLVRVAPQHYTAEVAKAKRRGKIYIDWLRNDPESTAIASWSTRARPGAPVAAPLSWDEIDAVERPRVTVRDAPARLELPDPWAAFEDSRRAVTAAMRRRVGAAT